MARNLNMKGRLSRNSFKTALDLGVGAVLSGLKLPSVIATVHLKPRDDSGTGVTSI